MNIACCVLLIQFRYGGAPRVGGTKQEQVIEKAKKLCAILFFFLFVFVQFSHGVYGKA